MKAITMAPASALAEPRVRTWPRPDPEIPRMVQSRTLPVLMVCLACLGECRAQPRTIDACESLDGWSVLPSDGVRASASIVDGADGRAIRLDYNFEAGSGFVV